MRARILIAAVVGAVVALGAVWAVAASRPDRAGGPSVGPTGFAGGLRPPSIPPARFALRDERGRLVRAVSLRGRAVALMFVYSTCEDTCPLTAQQVRGALDSLNRADVTALAVSVDPRADTVPNVRRFLAEQHIAGRVPYLRGTRAELVPVWREFGIKPQERDSEHGVSVVLLDRMGRQRVGFGVDDLTAEGVAHDLKRLAG